tara:strand:- start:212 stop:820 length:609 start_codon:yes stop_codon:yes gene_type:complete
MSSEEIKAKARTSAAYKMSEQNLELFLKIPRGLDFTGALLIVLAQVFDVYDLEVSGYFLISFAILIVFVVLMMYKTTSSPEAHSQHNKGDFKSIAWNGLTMFLQQLPAVTLFAQFISIGIIMLEIKNWVLNNEAPAIYNKIKRFIILGLIVQYILYQLFYVKKLKDNSPYNFNTCAFLIISLITISLIAYLKVIVKFLTVDG